MKVREFIKPNRNGTILVTIYDNLDVFLCPSINDATMVRFLDREVRYWTVDSNTLTPGLSIYLKEVDDEG